MIDCSIDRPSCCSSRNLPHAEATVFLWSPLADTDTEAGRHQQVGDLFLTDGVGVELHLQVNRPRIKLGSIPNVRRSHSDADHIFTRVRLADDPRELTVNVE